MQKLLEITDSSCISRISFKCIHFLFSCGQRAPTEVAFLQGPGFCVAPLQKGAKRWWNNKLGTQHWFHMSANLFQSRRWVRGRGGSGALGLFFLSLLGWEGRIRGWEVRGRTRWLIEPRHEVSDGQLNQTKARPSSRLTMIKYISRLCHHMCPSGGYIISTCAYELRTH